MIELGSPGVSPLSLEWPTGAGDTALGATPASQLTTHGLALRLRRARPGDEPRLAEFFAALSPDSVYRRFLTPRRRYPRAFLEDFICVGAGQQEIQLALHGPPDLARIVGIGQFVRSEGQVIADAALVVRDEFHRLGVGSALLQHLTALAEQHGYLAFRAEVLPENWPLLHLLAHLGLDLEARHEHGLITLTAHFG